MDEPRSASMAAADSAAFWFDRPAEEWVQRVGRIARGVDLGRLGRYELLGVAGHGGQGVVYRAREQSTGRGVALKRLLGGPWSGEGERLRFAREIEVDVALHHPHIVTVYSAEVIDGQAVLAMEWVDGAPIDTWAMGDGGGRATGEILEAVLKVCDAIHHAHQRGVIHRDLKPSNILVDESGQPRVLDFGLAKLRWPEGEARGAATATQGFVGTVAYAAPEQVRGDRDAVDVRTDVYSLGCVLYECLAGRGPFGGGRDLAALTREICEREAPPPSSLRRHIDRDLDAIVARAMAKERERRYPSVESLAADIRRHLAHEPVEARGPNVWYRGRRMVRRHAAATAAAATVVVVLMTASVVSTVLYLRAERDRALTGAVYEFMHEILTGVEHAQDVTLLEAIDKAAVRLDGAFPRQPLAEADVRAMIHYVYEQMGLYERAIPHAERSLVLFEAAVGTRDPRTQDALGRLMTLNGRMHRFDEAERHGRRLLELRRRRYGAGHERYADAAGRLGAVLQNSGRSAEAEGPLREALTINQRELGPDHEMTLATAHNLSHALASLGRRDEAAELSGRVFRAFERTLGREHVHTIGSLDWHAQTLHKQGKLADAERLLRDAAERASAALGEPHPQTLLIGIHVAQLLADRGDTAGAIAGLRAVLAVTEERLGGRHIRAIQARVLLGELLTEAWRSEEARGVLGPALEAAEATLGPGHAQTTRAREALARALGLQAGDGGN